jgi:hypothetical protein
MFINSVHLICRIRNKGREETKNAGFLKGWVLLRLLCETDHIARLSLFLSLCWVLTFDSEKEAYEFYNMYSWKVGFGIKYANSASNNKRGYHTGRDFRCLCSVSSSFC